MKLVQLVIPGRFEDVYLYMGHVLGLTRRRTLTIAPIATLLDRRLGDHGATRRLARLLFERNDQLPANRDWVKAALLSETTRQLRTLERQEPDGWAADVFEEFDLAVGEAPPLDVAVYNQRMFLGSSSGLFHLDLDFDPWPARPRGQLRRRLEARCLAVSVRFGSVAASAEDDGLFLALDEFGWLDQNPVDRPLTRVARRSRRTSWASFGLYNYQTNRQPDPMVGDVRRVQPRGIEQERTIFARVVGRTPRHEVDAGFRESGLNPNHVQYVWSTLGGLFVHTESGAVRYLRAKEASSESLSLGRPYSLPQVPGRVVSASSAARFSIVETDYAIWALVDGQRAAVVEDEATSVRTYPLSRWFKHVTTATLDDALLLTAVLGEPYSSRAPEPEDR